MTAYKYWAFGLQIESEIEFPELFPSTFEHADLKISLGITPSELTGDKVVQKVNVTMSPDEYIIRIVNVANYYAAHGNQIIVEAASETDEKSIRLFLLSNAMAAILHQRDMSPFHASAVFCEGGLALFCGRSGAGKSTLATALQLKGYKVFSDDVCVLKPSEDNNELLAYTSYPMIKLWEDSFEKVGLDTASQEDQIRPDMAKYARFYHEDFDIQAYPVKYVFVLDPDSQVKVTEIEKLPSLTAFTKLQRNSYRYVQMNAMNKRNVHFSVISKLSATQVYQISRPGIGNTIEDVIRLVESKLTVHA